jgi:FkbM family methyltransferase
MLGRHARGSHAAPASPDDIEACSRLLLGRDPDAQGLAHYRERVAAEGLSVVDLVAELVSSPEFFILHPGRGGPASPPVVVGTGDFEILVDADDQAIGQAIAITGDYEPEVSRTLRGLLEPGAVFVDVGANYGWHSLVAARAVGEAGRVISVEPNPRNAGLLRQSAGRNGFPHLTVMAVAAGDEHGLAALETDGSNGRIVGVDASILEALACSFVVPLRRLDHIVEQAGDPRVDVMKIDVEGFELAALRGGRRVITRDRPVIVSEFFPRALLSTGGIDPAEYLDALRELGYSISVIGRDGPVSNAQILDSLDEMSVVDLLAAPA